MNTTEKILDMLVDSISCIEEVKSIGICGSKSPLPKAGEADIDIFVYCDEIPEAQKRQEIISNAGEVIKNGKVNVLEGGHWGVGDFVLINGVETWLMFFTIEETNKHIDAILNGEYPDKLDNYYYPIGRCAMLKDMTVLYDAGDFLGSLKKKLSAYPKSLSDSLVKYHLEELEDVEDLERAVKRKDVLFYHFALDLALDHFLQALFAANSTYFPSRKRNLQFIDSFIKRPENCSGKLLEVIRLGGDPEGIRKSYELWSSLVNELKDLLREV